MVKPKRVLIIDDDQSAREEIKRAFAMDEEFEFQITESAKVEDAINILSKERRFDLLVIDWRLEPSKDGGLELLREGKPYFPKIKIVYTAYATHENCVKAIRAGAQDYIDKNQVESLKKLLESAKSELRARKFEDHSPDDEWLSEHIEELMAYRGELIAFIDGKVVGHAQTRRALRNQVKEKYPNDEPYIMFAPAEAI